MPAAHANSLPACVISNSQQRQQPPRRAPQDSPQQWAVQNWSGGFMTEKQGKKPTVVLVCRQYVYSLLTNESAQKMAYMSVCV